MNKILSIIIPTYNMENYLRKCLDSLIISDENMQLLEVLIVNDGSKDSSSQIAHQYEDQYPYTFRVIDKENGNYGSCINRGIKEMKGKYVKILDADDYFDSAQLEVFISHLKSLDCDLILSDFIKIDSKGIPFFEFSHSQAFGLQSGEIHDFSSLCQSNPSFYGYMHSFTYKAAIFNNFNYIQTEGISYTDQEWVFIPILYVRTYAYLQVPIYYYLIGREGQTVETTNISRSLKQLVIVARRLSTIYCDTKETNSEVYFYFKNQITTLLRIIYKQGLILDKHHVNIDVMKDFDNDICGLADISYWSESFSYKKIKYVKLWRNHNRNQFPKWFLIYVRLIDLLK